MTDDEKEDRKSMMVLWVLIGFLAVSWVISKFARAPGYWRDFDDRQPQPWIDR